MSRKSYSNRVDANQSEIVAALIKIGCHVEPISGCPGMADIMVSIGPEGRKRTDLLEIKNKDGKNIVSDAQVKFHKRFHVTVVRTVQEALEAVTNNFRT